MLLVPVTCCELRVKARFIFPAPMLNLVGRKFKMIEMWKILWQDGW